MAIEQVAIELVSIELVAGRPAALYSLQVQHWRWPIGRQAAGVSIAAPKRWDVWKLLAIKEAV